MYMIIETQNSDEMVFGEQPTPAHYYTGTSNLSDILDDMARGNIPINTGQPFPVIWKGDIDPNSPPFQTDDRPFVPINGNLNIFNL